MKILIADDDPTTRKKLEFLLTRFGWEVSTVGDGARAVTLLTQDDAPRLAILDIGMPRLSGIEVCREMRRLRWDVPPYLIILTVRGSGEDIVRGFEAGADDYLVKPFDADELRARVGVGKRTLDLQQRLVDRIWQLEEALERVSQLQGLLRKDNNIYEFGSFRLEAAECRLLKNGDVVALPAKVFDLLLFLVQNKGHLITKEELLTGVWRGKLVEDNNLTVAMSALRKALDESNTENYIETVPKRGYRFAVDVKVGESA